MPDGDPQGYVDEGMDPMEAEMLAAGGGMPPEMGMDPTMGGAPQDEDAALAMLLEAVLGKWGGSEAQIAGEKGILLETLMAIAQPVPEMDAGGMAAMGAPPMGMEAPMGAPVGDPMMGMPMGEPGLM